MTVRDRASADRAMLLVPDHELRRAACACDRAGAVRAADHRDHPVSVCGPVHVEETHRPGTGRTVRHPVSESTVATMTTRPPTLDVPHQVKTASSSPASRVRRDRCWSRRAASGAVRHHRPLHPDHLLHQARPRRHRRHGRARPVPSRAVHVAWAPYDTYIESEHQLCCAHALRELQGVADTAPPDAQRCCATQVSDAPVAMQHLAADAIATGADRIDPDALAEQVRRYRSAAQIDLTETATRSDKPMQKHNALARRLLDRQDDYLRFTTGRRIPADNNRSERDIRMIKLRQKVSACLRTLTGAKQFCAIPSYLSTAAKHAGTSSHLPQLARPTLAARHTYIKKVHPESSQDTYRYFTDQPDIGRPRKKADARPADSCISCAQIRVIYRS